GSRADLEGAKVGILGRRPPQSRLHRPGWGRPARTPWRSVGHHRDAVATARHSRRQRVSCRRRQPASADPLRRPRTWRARSRRGACGRNHPPLHPPWRLDHRRARHRTREAAISRRNVRRTVHRLHAPPAPCDGSTAAGEPRQETRGRANRPPRARPPPIGAGRHYLAGMTHSPATIDDLRHVVVATPRLSIRGGGTKPGLSGSFDNRSVINMAGLTGITEHTPEECTFSALAGTP